MKKIISYILIVAVILTLGISLGGTALAADNLSATVRVSTKSLLEPGPVSVTVSITNNGDPVTDLTLSYPDTDEKVVLGDIATGETKEHTNSQWQITEDMMNRELKFGVSWVSSDGSTKTTTTPGVTITKKEANVSATASASVDRDSIKSGESVNYKFSIKNTGNVALSNVTLTASPLKDGKALNDPFSLQPGSSRDLTWKVSLSETTQITPVFNFTANGQTQKVAADAVKVTVEEEKKDAMMRLDVRADRSQVKSGEEVEFSVELSNTGTASLSDITVKDFEGNAVNMSKNSLDAEQSTKGKVTIKIAESGNYSFTASAKDDAGNSVKAESSSISIKVEEEPTGPIDPATVVGLEIDVENTKLQGAGDAHFIAKIKNLTDEPLKNIIIQETTTGASNTFPTLEAQASTDWDTVIPVAETSQYVFTVSAEMQDGTIVKAEAAPIEITVEAKAGLSTFQLIMIIFLCAIAGVAITLGVFIYKHKQQQKNAKAVPEKTGEKQRAKVENQTRSNPPKKRSITNETIEPKPKSAQTRSKKVRFDDRNKF